MPITDGERAGHAIRVKAPALARSAAAALYRLRPDLEHRYGEDGRRHCEKDVGHHLRFLAAAVELDDPKVFGDYAAWAAGVMIAHNVAEEDTLASFRCLLDVVPAAVPQSPDRVREIITSALRRLESPPATASASEKSGAPHASGPKASPSTPSPPNGSPSTASTTSARS